MVLDRERSSYEVIQTMSGIFISYAREDRQKVATLAKELEDRGWSVWWDWTIPVGKTWRQVISEALEAAGCVVVAWSNTSINSNWVHEEAEEGRARNILTPVLIEDVRPPLGFRQMQAANLVDWQGEPGHPEFKKLLHAIGLILGSPKRKEKAEPGVPPKALPKKPPGSPSTNQPASESVLTNSIGMNFVLIPTGSFTMGSRTTPKEIVDRFGGEEEWYKLEKPQHSVKIVRPFYLQATPVTQGQWQQVMEDNPSNFKACGEECPVENVSWNDAQQFLNKLNQVEKIKDYRLPSEAEWEYASRAGSDSEFFFGDDHKRLGEFAWYSENSESKTHPVGGRKPNSWGLYDMHGNVWEWVEDDWHDSYKRAPDDGRAWIDKPRGSVRVIRGGGWRSVARGCRSARRVKHGQDSRVNVVGFRLSRPVPLGS